MVEVPEGAEGEDIELFHAYPTLEEAYGEFLENYDFLRSLLRFRVEDAVMEDVLSEVALRYVRRRVEQHIAFPRAYLATMARFALKDHQRARLRYAEVPVGDDWELMTSPEPERSAEDTVVENFVHKELLLKVKSLPVHQHQAIVLIYIKGMSFQEAAKALDIPVRLLHRTHSRALKTLRGLYGVGPKGKTKT